MKKVQALAVLVLTLVTLLAPLAVQAGTPAEAAKTYSGPLPAPCPNDGVPAKFPALGNIKKGPFIVSNGPGNKPGFKSTIAGGTVSNPFQFKSSFQVPIIKSQLKSGGNGIVNVPKSIPKTGR